MTNKKYPDRFTVNDEHQFPNFSLTDNDEIECQNEYDEKDVNDLNKLIASEASAIDEYFDASKNTHDVNLKTLYADIGAEERFHQEQLLYAKSVLTGEKYDPRDPNVKKEYQELIDNGMDEESALSTITDKHHIADGIDDDDDSMKLTEDTSIIEFAINQFITNMEMIDTICEYDIPEIELQKSIDTYIESFVFMEETDNTANANSLAARGTNPIKLIITGFHALIKFIFKLIDLIKTMISKHRIKSARKKQWLKSHSIKELFVPGITFYFYSDKNLYQMSEAPLQYIDLLNKLTVMIGKQIGITVPAAPMPPYITPIKFNSIQNGIDIASGVVLTKSKVIVTDANEDQLKNIFFGYTENSTYSGKSFNIYNTYEALSKAMKTFADISEQTMKLISGFEGNVNSIYYKNRKAYNTAVNDMKIILKCFNMFIKALAHDMDSINKLNDGMLLGQTSQMDQQRINNINNKQQNINYNRL